MTRRRPRRGAVAALALGLLAPLTGCGLVADVLGGGDPVHETGIEPVALDLAGPTYQAVLADGRLLVRRGTDQQVLDAGSGVAWLPDGRALANLSARRLRLRLVDPASGPVGRMIRDQQPPSRGVTGLHLLRRLDTDRFRLIRLDLDLAVRDRIDLPPTDNPDATTQNGLERNYHGAVPTIDGSTFVRWHDGSEWYEDGDHGVLMLRGDELRTVLVNANIVGFFLSADGAGLIGLRQVRGEPCGGCHTDQDLVEIDPATGEVAAEYGMPDPYDEHWRVSAVDKVGGRVAVRFYETVELDAESGRSAVVQRGTWVYDGEWSMVGGSEQELTWWQGEDRVVARVDPTERGRRDGWELMWLHDGQETALRGELNRTRLGEPVLGSVAGQLLPPG